MGFPPLLPTSYSLLPVRNTLRDHPARPGSLVKLHLYEKCTNSVGILYLLSAAFMCYNRVATVAIIIQALTGPLDQISEFS